MGRRGECKICAIVEVLGAGEVVMGDLGIRDRTCGHAAQCYSFFSPVAANPLPQGLEFDEYPFLSRSKSKLRTQWVVWAWVYLFPPRTP